MSGEPSFVQGRDGHQSASVRVDFQDGSARFRGEKNDIPWSPCPTTPLGRIADRLDGSPGQIQTFELEVSKESQLLAIGRPEWKLCTLGVLQLLGLQGL